MHRGTCVSVTKADVGGITRKERDVWNGGKDGRTAEEGV